MPAQRGERFARSDAIALSQFAALLPGVLGLTANVRDEPPNTEKPAGSGIVDEFTVTRCA